MRVSNSALFLALPDARYPDQFLDRRQRELRSALRAPPDSGAPRPLSRISALARRPERESDASRRPLGGSLRSVERFQSDRREIWIHGNFQAAYRVDHFRSLGRGRWFCFEWEWKGSQGSELQFDGESFWTEGQGFVDIEARLSRR